MSSQWQRFILHDIDGSQERTAFGIFFTRVFSIKGPTIQNLINILKGTMAVFPHESAVVAQGKQYTITKLRVNRNLFLNFKFENTQPMSPVNKPVP